MNLCAALVVRNEVDRYLPLVLADLRGFCDQIIVLDDGSDDDTDVYLRDEVDEQLSFAWNNTPRFYAHEGRCRQQLLTLVLASEATHVLCIDADELVGDGPALRATLERRPDEPLWSLSMTEVWEATPTELRARVDGGWRVYERPMVWRVPDDRRQLRMLDRKLACSRVPAPFLRMRPRAAGLRAFHFGWTDPATRQARYDRYVTHDGGKFHASSHLQSIMWPESRMQFESVAWPDADWTDAMKGRLL